MWNKIICLGQVGQNNVILLIKYDRRSNVMYSLKLVLLKIFLGVCQENLFYKPVHNGIVR